MNNFAKQENNPNKYISDESKSGFNLPWKLILPDEFANITFISNNTYSGCISRKMMEGKGVYKWSNGAQYKVITFNSIKLYIRE